MKIETKLTDRDKTILVLIGMVVVTAVFMLFIILPLNSANDYMKGQIEENEVRMQEMQQKVALLSSVEAVNADDKARLALSQQELYPMLRSQDIDQLMTELMMKHGLSAKRLGITMPETPANLTAYLHEDGAQSNPDGVDALYRAQVLLKVEGRASDIHAFVDELALEAAAIRIERLDWTDDDAPIDPQTGMETSYRGVLDAELSVYMSDKSSDAEVTKAE